MKKFLIIIFAGLIIFSAWFLFSKIIPVNQNKIMREEKPNFDKEGNLVLPQPKTESKISIEEAILKRRSVREYKDEPLTLKEISQILWSAQGITNSSWGGRTAPSAGALYPLEVYLIVRKAENLGSGVYKYLPEGHKIKRILEKDISTDLARAALGQMFIAEAPVSLVISAVYSRTIGKYGDRGIQYVHLETGHAAQNVYLQVESLGLGTVTIGAFDDERIKEILTLSEEEIPLYIMPIGKVENND